MRNGKYEAFTLIEMLIVMGILIILMVIGIAAGRFALFRAADVAHRNAADQIYEGLQAYFVDNRAFPGANSCGGTEEAPAQGPCTVALLMSRNDKLGYFMDLGAFNGGADATFSYFTGNNDQAVLVCVSMRGLAADNVNHDEGAFYCAGNGFDTDQMTDAGGKQIKIQESLITSESDAWQYFATGTAEYTAVVFDTASDWENQGWTELE